MLNEVKVPEMVYQIWKYIGRDFPGRGKNKLAYIKYPHKITYEFNSRGFRDREWPDNLEDAIWCVGDGFTLGTGSPHSHTWPFVLENKSRIRTVNISMEGAENDWISQQCNLILKEIKPKALVVMWGPVHNLEKNIDEKKDKEIFLSTRKSVIDNIGTVLYADFTTPGHKDIINDLIHDKYYLGSVRSLDYSRDYRHFDLLTSQVVASKLISNLNL